MIEDEELEIDETEIGPGDGLRRRLEDLWPDLELDRGLDFGAREKYAAVASAGLVLLVTAFFVSGFHLKSPEQGGADDEKELTAYQRQYVDCPPEYLETCTRMSKLPTEPITYWKTENGKLYLKLEDGRAIITTLPGDSAPGEFVTYMSAAEVDRAEGGGS